MVQLNTACAISLVWLATLTSMAHAQCSTCGRPSTPNVNNFTSRAAMEAGGWTFGWNDNYDFLPLPNPTYCPNIASDSYCGFQHPGDSELNLTLVGVGTATFSFGNTWRGGTVTAWLNGVSLGVAASLTPYLNVTFDFTPGDVLRLTEAPSAVHAIHGIWFSCPSAVYQGSYTADSLVCSAVTPCSSSEYTVSPATSTSDTVCRPTTACNSGQYAMTAATSSTDAVCFPVTRCTAAEYQTSAATATANTGCRAVDPCQPGFYQTAPPDSTTNRQCATVRSCVGSVYTSTEATDTVNAQCSPVTTCSSSQLTAAPATPSSDAVCTCRPCAAGQAAQVSSSGGCPVCVPLVAPSGGAAIVSTAQGITIAAASVNVHGANLVSWMQTLQSQVQQLQLQNAQLTARIEQLSGQH